MNNEKNNSKQIELKDVYDVLTDIRNTLKESSKWAKFAGIKEVKPVLESALKDDTKKRIYLLSDGVNSSYAIAKTLGVNDTVRRAISDYWDEWEKAGLGESKPAQGGGSRFKRSFDLGDFGIPIPELPKQEPKQTPTVEEQSKQEVEPNAG